MNIFNMLILKGKPENGVKRNDFKRLISRL
jgi:hypothetical protein